MLHVEIDDRGAFRVARPIGELGMAEADDLKAALQEYVAGEGSRLVIDLSKLETISSSGLSVLMNLVARARLSGGNVVLTSPTPFVANVFHVTHLDHWFDLCKDLAQAEEKLLGLR